MNGPSVRLPGYLDQPSQSSIARVQFIDKLVRRLLGRCDGGRQSFASELVIFDCDGVADGVPNIAGRNPKASLYEVPRR